MLFATGVRGAAPTNQADQHLGDVELAVLETNGSFSFFSRQGGGTSNEETGPDKG